MLSKTILPFVVAASLALPAQAEFYDDVKFRYEKSELETSARAERLYKRLAKRAESACVRPGLKSLQERAVQKRCTELLTEDFVSKIDHPRISQIHDNAVRIAAD
jgi:UrcA family protein